jgi:Guanine nucleotide exchange factor synembryn
MFLKPETRKVFVQVGGMERFVKLVNGRTASRDADDDFLLGRIGFLLTTKKDDIVERLVNNDHILDALAKVSVRAQC